MGPGECAGKRGSARCVCSPLRRGDSLSDPGAKLGGTAGTAQCCNFSRLLGTAASSAWGRPAGRGRAPGGVSGAARLPGFSVCRKCRFGCEERNVPSCPPRADTAVEGLEQKLAK